MGHTDQHIAAAKSVIGRLVVGWLSVGGRLVIGQRSVGALSLVVHLHDIVELRRAKVGRHGEGEEQ